MSQKTPRPNSPFNIFFKKTFAPGTFFAVGFVMCFSVAIIAAPQKAEALVCPTCVPVDSAILNTITSDIAVNENAQTQKEYTLDGIATQAAKVVISNITSSIVSWINSGFRGSPAFVSNPESFFTDVADQVAGNFIAGTELGFLCEPFSLDIRLALNFSYSSSYIDRNYCRLSDTVSNVENFTKFTNGDFSQGGWDSWFQITQNPSNNPLGAYIGAQNELSRRIASKVGLEQRQLDWGSGFLSYRECLQEDIDGNCLREGNIQTPGSVIESQLDQTLGGGLRQLELADEFNEIVGALIGQVAKTVLTQGLSSFGGGGINAGTLNSGSPSTPLTVWCAPSSNSAEVGQSVRWSAVVYGGIPGATEYYWSGDGTITGASTASVSVSYYDFGLKTAAVRVTKGGQYLFQNCTSGVNVVPAR